MCPLAGFECRSHEVGARSHVVEPHEDFHVEFVTPRGPTQDKKLGDPGSEPHCEAILQLLMSARCNPRGAVWLRPIAALPRPKSALASPKRSPVALLSPCASSKRATASVCSPCSSWTSPKSARFLASSRLSPSNRWTSKARSETGALAPASDAANRRRRYTLSVGLPERAFQLLGQNESPLEPAQGPASSPDARNAEPSEMSMSMEAVSDQLSRKD